MGRGWRVALAGAAVALGALGLCAAAFAASPSLRPLAEADGVNLGAAAQSSYLPGDADFRATLDGYANTITFENEAKWAVIHPERERYDFTGADRLARWAWKRGMLMRGHVLIWHAQNPDWLKALDPSPAEAKAILRDHIFTVVGHFREKFPGLIAQWDVVNEVVDNDGTPRQNVWQRWIGDGYIPLAFKWARKAAGPGVELFLNDYFDTGLMAGAEAIGGDFDDGDPVPMTTPGAEGSLGCDAVLKCRRVRELVSGLVRDGVPINGVGFQAHMADPDPSDYRALTRWVGKLGLQWAITEADVPVPDDPSGTAQARQAGVFATALDSCLDDPACDTYVTWGVSDRHTWWTGLTAGALDDALPYDAAMEPKPAVAAMAAAFRAAAAGDACGAGERRRLRLPGWARRPSTARLRTVVVGTGSRRAVDERQARRGSVRVDAGGARSGPVELRVTGAVPDRGAGKYVLRRGLLEAGAC